MTTNRKLTISLPEEIISYADRYKVTHDIASRSEVLLIALKRLREQELADGYKAMAESLDECDDLWLDSNLDETIQEIDNLQ